MSNRPRLQCLSLSLFAAFAISPYAFGQASVRAHTALTSDWTSQQIVFSRPATRARAERLQRDPRYWQQRLHRSLPARQVADETAIPEAILRLTPPPKRQSRFHRDWSEDMGLGASVGPTNYPAKYSFSLTSANCGSAPQPDFTVYATGLAGSGSQASIVAYDNLYSGCTAPVPKVYWSYNTAGTVTTSPVFSDNGTQVAFVQTDNSNNGQLVLLTWATSGTFTTVLPNLYHGCTAPCMTTLPLQTGGGTPTADASSSVFYDYSHDIAYVGDESGLLHKFNPVFDGTPTEVTTGNWPVHVSSSASPALTSPVYDSTSGNVFVCDNAGYLYQVNANTASVVQSGQLDFSASADGGPGIVQGPMVDSDAELVYVFVTADGSGNCTGFTADCSGIIELPAGFTITDIPVEAVVGASTIEGSEEPNPMFIGRFDSTYINSGNATGNFYVCGNTGGAPTLYQVQMTGGSFIAEIPGPALSSSSTPCSPVTDIYNPNTSVAPTEWIFASAQDDGTSSACASGGCLYNFVDTPRLAKTNYVIGQEILDTHFQIQVVTKGGKSSPGVPSWNTNLAQTTPDGTVTWMNQGVQSATTPAGWAMLTLYHKDTSFILDPNGYIQIATNTELSGATEPTFTPEGAGNETTDGLLTWINAGKIATYAISAEDGTSGLIMDNTVTTGGASQVYFSTLGNQACGTSGTGGCAVQASQAQLQ
jgi:hypothetical protein